MVQSINKKERTITISLHADSVEDLFNHQQAIITLLRNYDYENYGDSCKETVCNALDLLTELMPDLEVQTRGFVAPENYLELPDNMSAKSKEILKEAIFTLKTGTKVRSEINPIYQILKTN
jgi:hypothetical protein